jgi:ribosomal protein S18 acetylase RimI-like enzyme
VDIAYRNDCAGIDWRELAAVIERAPLGKRDPAILQVTFGRSYAVCFATEGGRLVGAGRAISDGAVQSAIYDVVVLPECQGRGIGAEIVRRLLARLPTKAVLLVSAPGKEEFYRKLGFKRLRTAMLRRDDPQPWIDAGYLEP